MAAAGRLKTRIACLICWPPLPAARSRIRITVQTQYRLTTESRKEQFPADWRSWHVEKTCREIIGTNRPDIETSSLQLGTNYSTTALARASSSLSACRRFRFSLDRAREELT